MTASLSKVLFPTDLPACQWRQFEAQGYSAPVWGVVYNTDDTVTNGMPVGGVDTGCLDLETDGLLGYCTLFNSHVPRRGPMRLPYLGLSTGGKTWVLCKPKDEASAGLLALTEWQLEPALGPHQRLWAPGPALLPAWFKSVGELPYDIPAGRVACHSPAVLRWTSPAKGKLQIEGGLWLARNLYRPQLWELRKAGEFLTGGRLDWGATSAAPVSFASGSGGEDSLVTDVAEGEILELLITNASTFGDYVGLDMRLSLEGQSWDVASDWSDSANPNGAWTYDSVSREATPAGLFGADSPVQQADEITYWGHYPIADMHFKTSAPIETNLRAWSPFIPGDIQESMLPGAVFEVQLANTDSKPHLGTVVMTFPGPTQAEAGTDHFTRKPLAGGVHGVEVRGKLASYTLSVAREPLVRVGGGLKTSRKAWQHLDEGLPEPHESDASATVAVDFELAPGETRVVPFLLTWSAPTWKGGGTNNSPAGNTFTHMYSRYFPDTAVTAHMLASRREGLFRRIAAWQQAIYTDESLPGWLRDSLINVLYMITEDGYWAVKAAPLPDWVKAEDGLFGLNECPRGCPQIECIPCSFYGSLPLAYFFPELQLSTIRGYQGYQLLDGAPPWIFGGCTGQTPPIDFACPTRGYQFASNGISLAGIVDRFLLCRDDANKTLTRELYSMMKASVTHTVGLRTTPSYSIGERIISMPDGNVGTEWFEAPEPGWAGMTAHIGGLHLAELRIVQRMAHEVGDTEFEQRVTEWLTEAQQAMEARLWDDRGYYINYFEPETGQRSEFVFGYQLDGEWVNAFHGLPATLPEHRIKQTLETIKRCNVSISRHGAVNYSNPDGSVANPGGYGAFSYFPPELLMLAMTYMYEGEVEYGLELARKSWDNLICLQGYTWDMPNIMRGDVDTGERVFGNDYYQDMMLWSLPAAMERQDASGPCRPGGLVDRVLQAGKEGAG